MTNSTDLEKAREWLTPWRLDGLPAYNHPESPTLESAMLEFLARFRAEAVVEGLRLAETYSKESAKRFRSASCACEPGGTEETKALHCGQACEAMAAGIRALADKREKT